MIVSRNSNALWKLSTSDCASGEGFTGVRSARIYLFDTNSINLSNPIIVLPPIPPKSPTINLKLLPWYIKICERFRQSQQNFFIVGVTITILLFVKRKHLVSSLSSYCYMSSVLGAIVTIFVLLERQITSILKLVRLSGSPVHQ